MRILLTNDDGVGSLGLHALKAALDPLGEVVVIAPDRNRSAIARAITIHGLLSVKTVVLPDGSTAYATDGTPVDCVRLAAAGLVGAPPDLVVSGINLGLNAGDDVAYSGTVGAAIEGLLIGLPAIAVSTQTIGKPDAEERWRAGHHDFRAAAVAVAALVPRVLDVDFPAGVLLNVNTPALAPDAITGAAVTRLGRRIYRDRLDLIEGSPTDGRYRLYGEDVWHGNEVGTDLSAIDRGEISVTPLHYDLTETDAAERMADWALDALHLGHTTPETLDV